MNREEFENALKDAPSESTRIAWFGALLTREANLAGRLLIVGGSAIEVYLTSSRYVSADIDLVGDSKAIVPVLRRWGFHRKSGRDHRIYWVKSSVGYVDLVGKLDRTGLPPRREPTPFGDVLLAPVEALIVRRLMRAAREKSPELLRQAEALAIEYGRDLDWAYIRAEASYEKFEPILKELVKQVK
jgi:hypothetical protein